MWTQEAEVWFTNRINNIRETLQKEKSPLVKSSGWRSKLRNPMYKKLCKRNEAESDKYINLLY